MEKRKLGNSGLEIAPLVFGGNVFGMTVDQSTSFALLDAFVGAGFNCIDTADVYSRWVPGNKGGESETIIGNWLSQRGNREKVVIATKAGMDMGGGKKGLSRKYLLEAVEDSLRRLKTDYIDLYQAHADDPETPQEETLEAFAHLVKQGKVRAIGASNFSAQRLDSALKLSREQGLPSYVSLQPLYNLYDRSAFEDELQPLCLEKGVAVITYFSLASGFLTGKYRSKEDLAKYLRGSSVKQYLTERGTRILDALDQVAQKVAATPARVALAWLMTRPGVTAPIASATKPEQLAEMVAATKLALDPASLELLDQASAWRSHQD